MADKRTPITPTLGDRDVQLTEVLSQQQDQYEDCMPCRLMGSAAFTGLGFYTYYSGRKQLLKRKHEIMRSGSRFGIAARKAGLVGMSTVLVGVGAWRLVN
ncbi:hypothetical protein LTR37_007733 [Vermiconidia calcicola]|uniref:Uncharacterized protein n=1 Tax=Vermiconidia calcicola TaxID=1690605 RepID=A0ACC3NCI9_9PEZI|nr:hypothetical protein LTR37_007733 [Vermiconidia calcicola]